MKLFGIQVASQETLDYFDGLISKTGGNGRSIVNFGYLIVIVCGVFSATLMTTIGVVAAARHTIAGDAAFWGVFWGSNIALWTAMIGFVSSNKKHSANVTKEITMSANKKKDEEENG
jgi:hypothetical protein